MSKICIMCEKSYEPTGRCQKVCAACKKEYERQKAHAAHLARYKQKGSYKWEMPKGKDSPFFTTGIGCFSDIAYRNYERICMRCGSTKYLCVHHKDRNRENNEVSNLEVLCKSCHQKEHDAAAHLNSDDVKQAHIAKLRAFALSRTDQVRDELGRFKKHL